MSQEVTSAVTSFVQTSIGLEMIEADESQILVANLIEHDAIDTRKIIERMGLLVKSMIWDFYVAASTGDLNSIKDMDSRDTEVDRIYWLTSRQYNIYQKDVAAPHKMSLPLYEMTACLFLSRVLEGIGDHAVSMSECLIAMGGCNGGHPAPDKNIHNLGQKVTDLLTKSVKSWITKDIMLAEQAIREAEELNKEMDVIALSNATKGDSFVSINETLLFSSRRMNELCKGIAEFAFNLAME